MAINDYEHKKIEPEVQKRWEEEGLYTTPENPSEKNKRYVLAMFPYPSGEGLHVGHVVSYTATDMYVRFLRMQGFEVLHPMGWDAFGLPAENYAVKTGVHPQETTNNAIENFRSQIKSLGLSYDWSREVNTSSPEYYRWTQWLFLQFYKNGLAYKKKAAVNWCPGCQTVLANEQVVEGVCERCDSAVAKKDMEQWFFAITKYAEELLLSLKGLDWPESTKAVQKNWIGKSEGAELYFPINKKCTYVLVHGYAGGADAHFLPWLQKQLEEKGHTVLVPTLPNTKNPNIEEQISFLKKEVTFDEDTIVVAHSLGSVVALKTIESLNVPIKRLITVGGFLDTDIATEKKYFATFDWKFDFKKIKENVREIVVLHDENDDVIPVTQAEKFERRMGARVVRVVATKPHFRGDAEATVLRAALSSLKVFTTRPDTLFGATYMVVAPEHPLLEIYTKDITNYDAVQKYVRDAKNKTDIERSKEGGEKTGVQLEGLTVLNPATNTPLPVFVADYVLPGYGSGAIMAVPAHDERDFQFAQNFGLPIIEVVQGEGELPRSSHGTLINSGAFSDRLSEEAREEITETVGGEMKTTYRLRDWLLSRQRYWGAPIPIVYDPDGNPHMVPEEYLPWLLPTDVDYNPKGTSPLGSSIELKERTERLFGPGWTPEIDTMDTFVDSSWYFLRFTDPHNSEVFADREKLHEWLPVNTYVGGAEHAVLHLLYSRFFVKALRDLGYLEFNEPFSALRHQGMILAPDGDKMSKSKGNIINPDEMIERFGADTLRAYEMFMGPFEQNKAWSTDNMIGVRRFIEKVWRLSEKVSVDSATNPRLLAQTIKKVTHDIETFRVNTVVSTLMICANAFEKMSTIAQTDFEKFLKLLAPLAPHITDALWRNLGNANSIHVSDWPHYEEKDLETDEESYVVQVNGKVRDTITVPTGTLEEDLLTLVRTEKIEKWIEDKEIKKTIIVKGKIVNFVV
ncbi:MAG: leucine--tRNA ligase [Candidatus Paceibacterota bacterium]